LLVTWQDPHTRRYHPVGVLSRAPSGTYRFRYLDDAHQLNGFLPFLGFSALDREYTSPPNPLLDYVRAVMRAGDAQLTVVRANPPELGHHMRLLVRIEGRLSEGRWERRGCLARRRG